MSSIIHFDAVFLEAFFIGHALSTAVNLLVLPKSSRDVVFDDVRQYLKGIQDVLSAEKEYVSSFERSAVLTWLAAPVSNGAEKPKALVMTRKHEEETLEGAIRTLAGVHSKLQADLPLAKRDIAWAVLTPADLSNLVRLLRDVFLGLRGMTILAPMFEKICEWRGWADETIPSQNRSRLWQTERHSSVDEDSVERQDWQNIFRNFRGPIEEVRSDVEAALIHVALVLGLEHHKPETPNNTDDPEGKACAYPGDSTFVEHFHKQVHEFHGRKSNTLRRWYKTKQSSKVHEDHQESDSISLLTFSREDQEQFFVILYMQHLFHTLLDSTFALVRFAEDHRASSSERQLIVPGRRKLSKFLRNLFKEQDTTVDIDVGNSSVPPTHVVALGDAFGIKRHPEHLPPTNTWQVLGDGLRKVSRFVSGQQSMFGLRVACAVMCVAIVAFLESTQTFFFNQRILWATIIIAFSMAPTSGQAFSLLLFRIIGSTGAACLSIANWYIVDGHPAGVLVFFYIFTFIEFYFAIKYPKYIGVWKVNLITRSIITGYALQTRKTGVQAPPATNALQYPIYLIAPYRLATTVAGVFVSFIWTVFPAPITSRSIIRLKLGQSLFLLATYYSSMHATITMCLSDLQGDPKVKSSPGRRLSKARNKIFSKLLTVLASLRDHRSFSKFEPNIGGEFPSKLYASIVAEVDTMLSLMNLVVHAATTSLQQHSHDTLDPSSTSEKETATAWKHHVGTLFGSADFASHNITTLLSLLASSVTNGQPLPPYLEPPMPYHLTREMQKMDPHLLSLKHALDPGYSAFAVVEVSCTMIAESLGRLLVLVRELVGEVDFGVIAESEKTK